jgi:GNAT superfamily N-acetyltransferase
VVSGDDALWLLGKIHEENQGYSLDGTMKSRARRQFLRLDKDGVRVGGAFLQAGFDNVVIDSIWVEPSSRRKGYGRELFRSIVAWSKEQNKRRIILSTYEFQDALPFWTSLGFQIFGQLDDYPEGQKLFYMQKRID